MESKFEYFPKLASELQLRIWESAIPPPRYVYVQLHMQLRGEMQTWVLRSKSPPPVILFVNTKSRAVAAKHYELTFAYEGSTPQIWFDFERDILRFDNNTFMPRFPLEDRIRDIVDPIIFVNVSQIMRGLLGFRQHDLSRTKSLALFINYDPNNDPNKSRHIRNHALGTYLSRVLSHFGGVKHLHAIVDLGFYGVPALPNGNFTPRVNKCSRLEWWDVEGDGYALAGAPTCYKEYRQSVEALTLGNASTLRPRNRASYEIDQTRLEWYRRHYIEKAMDFNKVVDAEVEVVYVRQWETPTIHYKVGMANPVDSFVRYWR